MSVCLCLPLSLPVCLSVYLCLVFYSVSDSSFKRYSTDRVTSGDLGSRFWVRGKVLCLSSPLQHLQDLLFLLSWLFTFPSTLPFQSTFLSLYAHTFFLTHTHSHIPSRHLSNIILSSYHSSFLLSSSFIEIIVFVCTTLKPLCSIHAHLSPSPPPGQG